MNRKAFAMIATLGLAGIASMLFLRPRRGIVTQPLPGPATGTPTAIPETLPPIYTPPTAPQPTVRNMPDLRILAAPAIRNLIGAEEGRIPYIYKDQAGHDTFGIGHKVTSYDDSLRAYSKDSPAPDIVVDSVFDRDVSRTLNEIDLTGVPLTVNQYTALASLVFNIGTSAYRKSTLRRKLIAGDIAGAADEFLRWKYTGGKPILLPRRQRERQIFLTP